MDSIALYEGNVNIMSNRGVKKNSIQKRKKEQTEGKAIKQESTIIEGHKIQGITKHLQSIGRDVISGLIVVFISFLCSSFWNFHTNQALINSKLGDIKEDFKELKEDFTDRIDPLNTEMVNLEKKTSEMKSDIKNMKSDIDNLENHISPQKVIVLSSLSAAFQETLESVATHESGKVDKVVPNDKVLATDKSGKKYRAKDLTGEKILVPYQDDGYEVYFYGQYNKKYHWNGNCIINTYKGSSLDSITEARYSDGKLKTYKRIWGYDKSTEISIWNYSKRKHDEKHNINIGETWLYIKTEDIKKSFNKDTVSVKDIINIKKFKRHADLRLEGYYYGNTSNGKFNDNTGKAYLIKYSEHGFVRNLYCGRFKDGKYEDGTGQAWYIAGEEDDKQYVYFKGIFHDNHPKEESDNKRETISNKEIYLLIKDKKFNADIKLYKS